MKKKEKKKKIVLTDDDYGYINFVLVSMYLRWIYLVPRELKTAENWALASKALAKQLAKEIKKEHLKKENEERKKFKKLK